MLSATSGCCAGLRLCMIVIVTQAQSGVLNGVWDDVTDVSSTHLSLRDEKDVEMSMPLEKAAQVLTPLHAMTVHKSQSRALFFFCGVFAFT